MPIDFYGYEFDDPRISRGARNAGLSGMLLGMQQGRQDPNDWAGFLTGAATGFQQGRQGYLADYLPIYLKQQQEAEAEAERQQQEEAARLGIDWMRGQIPGVDGDFMGPEQGFGGPAAGEIAQSIPAASPPFVPEVASESEFIAGLNREAPRAPEFDYALPPSEIFASPAQEFEFLSEQVPQMQAVMREREQATLEAQAQQEMLENVNQALSGLGYSGPPIPDIETGLTVLKAYAEPETEMTPYQQAQVARWGRMDAEEGAPADGMTPYQQFQVQRYLYEDAQQRAKAEAEANADPLFEGLMPPEGIQLQGGVAEEPRPEDFGLVLPANRPAPGIATAPTGTSPAPRPRTVTPPAVQQQVEVQTKAGNIVRSLPIPAELKDEELAAQVVEMLGAGLSAREIRDRLRLYALELGVGWGR